MIYQLEFKPKAVKDLQVIPHIMQSRILEKVELLKENLQGDIRKLTDFTPEYRLRIGDYRVLFEIEQQSVVIYRIRHRKESYS
ncbi:MAG: type II toxin-antitoxin system RelE/ParE family toxin [Desulfamplus sp.]|nr:type II toxin-antitoxin system RelE/ParE family toxin [Desulfamplus sp.]